MKTAISMPDELFRQADELARRLGMSRSELIAKAVTTFVARHRSSRVTEALDGIYAREPSGVDPAFARATSEILDDEGW